VKISEAWLSRPQKPGKYWDGRYGGLGVRVWADGHNKTWIFQKSGGTRRALGRWPAVSVNEARKIAADHNLAPGRRNGRETIAHVHDVWAQDLIARGKSPLTVKSRAGQLHKHAACYLKRDPHDITPTELTAFRSDLANHSVHVARDVTQHLITLIRFSTERDFRMRELPRPRETKRRKIEDIGTWWQAVNATNTSQQMKDAFAFAAFTGLREGDITSARRSNIRNGWLHIPTPKMGEGWAFDRHLPTQCLDLIERQLSNDVIFPFNRIRIKGHASTHACRHYFAGFIETELDAPRRITRAFLNHRGKSDVTDGYGSTSYDAQAEWSQKISNELQKRMQWQL
jgi:integrase